jgi:hypothetical protein
MVGWEVGWNGGREEGRKEGRKEDRWRKKCGEKKEGGKKDEGKEGGVSIPGQHFRQGISPSLKPTITKSRKERRKKR